MTLRMLINAVHEEECRVAICDDDRLLELELERADHTQLKGNVYKAAITRIEPSLQAAFLDIGSNRNGFLQINDINPAYFRDYPRDDNSGRYRGRPAIQDVLEQGQELIVQVVKDEREAKGATLTTNLSIPGRYLVLMVGNHRGGVSRKIVDEAQRYQLRQAVQNLKIPPGMGVIVRTAGINKTSQALQADLDALLETWFDIVSLSQKPESPVVLYKEFDLASRMIRDYYTSEIEEILVDCPKTHEHVLNYVSKSAPSVLAKLKLYSDPQPLFSHFLLDNQVEAIGKPEVILPSGGSIVMTPTEAIVTIDVNSGRSTGRADVEETAFETNKEAAEEIAKQLRLRDLGGLIVIDFIDMIDKRHKQIVERVLKDAVAYDKAKIEVGRISKFGLLEMSRQRLKASLPSQSQMVCPQCSGRGRVKSTESAALEALRKIQSSVYAGGVRSVRVRLAPGAALMLLNNKRQILSKLEESTSTQILIFADGRMKQDEYELELDTGHLHVSGSRLAGGEDERPQQREPQRRHDGGDRRRDDYRRQGRDNRGGGGGRYNQRDHNRDHRDRDRGPDRNQDRQDRDQGQQAHGDRERGARDDRGGGGGGGGHHHDRNRGRGGGGGRNRNNFRSRGGGRRNDRGGGGGRYGGGGGRRDFRDDRRAPERQGQGEDFQDNASHGVSNQNERDFEKSHDSGPEFSMSSGRDTPDGGGEE